MKRFTEYLNEDFDPAVFNADGGISIDDPTVLDAINSNLELATSCSYRTPYNALEEIRKALAYYKIFLSKGVFLDQNHGNNVFVVSQFGEKTGMNNQGEVVTANDSPLYVYFEWSLNEKGMYDIFACLCDQNELDEILADYYSELESDEDLQEQHSMGKVSKMLYKVVNQSKAAKQSADVDEYIEHEKQGKTFTQVNESSRELLNNYIKKAKKDKKKNRKAGITLATKKKYGSDNPNDPKIRATNEEAMPDLKKKMDAKKVSLPNMMRKEETINEVSRKAATSAYAAANDPDYYHPKADAILGHIKRKFGSKAARDAETHAYTSHFGRGTPSPGKDSLSGGLRQYLDTNLTKSGKIPKGTQKAMKNKMDPKKWQGYGRKVGGPKKKLPEETDQLDELKGTSTKGKMIDYTLRAGHQLHHSDPYAFDRTGQQAKTITKRMKGMALAGRKLDRMTKDK